MVSQWLGLNGLSKTPLLRPAELDRPTDGQTVMTTCGVPVRAAESHFLLAVCHARAKEAGWLAGFLGLVKEYH